MQNHNHYNRSTLVRTLAAWMPAEDEAFRLGFPERMAQWLHVSDAITLRSAHQAVERMPAAAKAATPGAVVALKELHDAVQQLRSSLGQAIARELQQLLNESAATGIEPDPEIEFALHQQLQLDFQRRMEMSVDALRHHVRETLAASGQARLIRLAAMDATLDRMLGGREQELLGTTVPAVSRRRFDLLRREAREATQGNEEPVQLDMIDAAATGASAGEPGVSWLAMYSASLKAVLNAELEHRLQPVLGMVEAAQVQPTAAAHSPDTEPSGSIPDL